jgi:hypothetical protein
MGAQRASRSRGWPIAVSDAPAYNREIVARAILEEVLRLHPERLTVDELSMRIVGDPEDEREVGTAAEAIYDLRASSLIRYRNDDQLVEPTQVVVRYVELVGSQ